MQLFSPKKESRPDQKTSLPSAYAIVDTPKKELLLNVTDVLFLVGIEGEVADRCYQAVDTKGDHSQEDVSQRSRLKACGLKRGVIDHKASDPSQEES